MKKFLIFCILATSNVHVWNYGAHSAEIDVTVKRENEDRAFIMKQRENQLEIQRLQLEELKRVKQESNKPGKTTSIPRDADLGKTFREWQDQDVLLEQKRELDLQERLKVQAEESRRKSLLAEQKRQEAAVQEDVEIAINKDKRLVEWRKSHPVYWARIKQIDNKLRTDPAFSHLPLAERFSIAADLLEAENKVNATSPKKPQPGSIPKVQT